MPKPRAELGPMQLLFNTAGVSVFGPLQNGTLEDWQWQFNVNLWDMVNGIQVFLPRMLKRGGTAVTRIDATVDFAWGKNSPMATIPADNFSVRWTGQVQPQFSGVTTFYALADDGVRLWVNDVLLVNRWVSNAGEGSGTITLVGGQKYTIRMEFFEKNNQAAARLSWSHASQAKQVIPQLRLYSQ